MGAWVNSTRFNTLWWNIKVNIRKFRKHSGGRSSPKEFKEIWKEISLRLILKDKGGEQHCLPFSCFLPRGWDIFEKEGTSSGCVEIEDWSTSVYFVLGFQENFMQSLSAIL